MNNLDELLTKIEAAAIAAEPWWNPDLEAAEWDDRDNGFRASSEENSDFIQAANPQAILKLIADYKRLQFDVVNLLFRDKLAAQIIEPLALEGNPRARFWMAGLGSVGVLVSRGTATATPEPEPQRGNRRIRQHLSQQRREEKRAIILAALLAGIEPAAIAELLRGNVQYNRRIIAMVRRLNQHRLERLNEPREQATTHPAPTQARMANAT